MGMDMYLYVFDGGCTWDDAKVSITKCLAWSPGGRYGRYGRRPAVSPSVKVDLKTLPDSPYGWDAAQVKEFLEKSNLKDLVETFEKHKIDGEVLMYLGRNELEEMNVTIGDQTKLLKLVQKLDDKVQEQQEKELEKKTNANTTLKSLSVTTWFDTCAVKAALHGSLSGVKYPRAVLGCYAKEDTHKDEEENEIEIPAGTCLVLMDMRDVLFKSISTGGSGGEERFTSNCSLDYQDIGFHVYSAAETKDMDLLYKNMQLNDVQKHSLRSSGSFTPTPSFDVLTPGASITMHRGDNGEQGAKLEEFGAANPNALNPMDEFPHPNIDALKQAQDGW